jgi:hypothetical protein
MVAQDNTFELLRSLMILAIPELLQVGTLQDNGTFTPFHDHWQIEFLKYV